MIELIKYKLLKWLMNDICEKSECGTCVMDDNGYKCYQSEADIFTQARKVWRI